VPHLFTLKNSSLVGDVMQATHFYALWYQKLKKK
jgi:hypothetical protein